jgi:hypothetical protein
MCRAIIVADQREIEGREKIAAKVAELRNNRAGWE